MLLIERTIWLFSFVVSIMTHKQPQAMTPTQASIEIMGCSDNSFSVSHYHEVGNNGLIRFSNHAPVLGNIAENEAMTRLMCVFTKEPDQDRMAELDAYCDRHDIDFEWYVIDNDNVDYIKMKAAKFTATL